MVIKNNELMKMLEEHGRQYTLTMYINRYFHMTQKQLDYVLNYEVNNNGKEKRRTT